MDLKTTPFDQDQLSDVKQLVEKLKPDQIIWLSGYLEGRYANITTNGNHNDMVLLEQPAKTTKLTILYGTDTGRSKVLAESLLEKAAARNITARIVSMYDYNPRKLKDDENIAVIVSTHGEGEPPDMAEEFYNYITGNRASKLQHLKFSVLALGDKSYRFFCKTGEDIDSAFTKLGAVNILPIVKCDVDFEEDAENWMNNFLQNLTPSSELKKTNGSAVIENIQTAYSKKNPFMATILEKIKITGRDSDKEVYHLELSLEDSGLTYEPGDSVGIFTKNPTSLVNQIIEKTAIDPKESVNIKRQKASFEETLTHHVEITLLSFDILQKYFEKTKNNDLGKLLNDNKLLDNYLYGNDLLDLIEDFPFKWNAADLVDILRVLPARLYSISSSQKTVGDEVHATVSVVRYEWKNRKREGACSSHLADNLKIGDKVPVYIEKNPAFKLPANGSNVIMVGAGTGIAPYRAFMQQRENMGIKGKSWIFFGERRFYSDFLYQIEWQKLLKSNNLEKMDVAFSRDQKEKIYVQHKLLENQKEVYEWIKNGAYFYLCGDMRKMAKDVNKTLLEIIQTQGVITKEQAEKYIKNLKREKRLQSDIY